MTPFNFLVIFVLLNLTFARSHANLTKEELHWKLVFPNTPMPKFLHDSLPKPGQSTIFISKVDLELEGVHDPQQVQYTTYQYADYDYSYDSGYDANYNYDQNYDGAYSPTSEGLNDSDLRSKYLPRRQSNYDNVATINETMYFFQEILLPGKKVNLPRLTQRSNKALFLPQQIVETIPMSSDRLPEILKNFSLKVESSYANYVRATIMNCERAEMIAEKKYCVTSLESFVDLSVSMLGTNIRLLSHQLGKGLKNPLFTIGLGKRDMGDNNIVCHKMEYPYAVYLCHLIKKTTVYKVPLVSMDRTKSNALVVCHKDTSGWNPNHIAFRFLKVKPGSVPICHFLGRDTIVWVFN